MSFDFLLAAILSARELVGIPYASDNFTDSEWAQFKTCREVMNERRTYQ